MKKANKNTPAEQEPPKMPLTRRNYVLLAIGFAGLVLPGANPDFIAAYLGLAAVSFGGAWLTEEG